MKISIYWQNINIPPGNGRLEGILALFKAGAEWNGNRKGRPRKEETIQKIKITWDVKTLARENSRTAIETLVEIMSDKKAGQSNRLAAANAILDRGYGKPQQTIEASVSVFEKMSDNELLQFLMGDVIEGSVADGSSSSAEMIEYGGSGDEGEDDEG